MHDHTDDTTFVLWMSFSLSTVLSLVFRGYHALCSLGVVCTAVSTIVCGKMGPTSIVFHCYFK